VSQKNDDGLGRVLGGRYELQRVLARGERSTVFEAVQLDLGRRVAIKVLLDPLDVHEAAQLRREAKALGKVTSPHVVSALDLGGGTGGEPSFVVMDRVEGPTLATLLGGEGALAEERAVGLAVQLLAALEAAHAVGIIHRDVRPSKVFVLKPPASGELVKLFGFGLARSVGAASGMTIETRTMTVTHVAPERLARADEVGPATDVYGAGVCLAAMLGKSRVDRELQHIVDKALSADPRSRYKDATAMRSALAAWSSRGRRTPPRRAGLLFGLAAGLTFVAGGLGLAFAIMRLASPESPPNPLPPDGSAPDGAALSAPPLGAASSSPDEEDASAPPASSGAAPAAGPPKAPSQDRAGCWCVSEGWHRRTLCTTPPQPSCGCVLVDDPAITLYRDAHAPDSTLWPSAPKRNTGDPCRGFVDESAPDGGKVARLADGRFSCEYCYGDPVARAVPSTPCRGIDRQGAWHDGHWSCPDPNRRPR
jgi:Protein kinase domain